MERRHVKIVLTQSWQRFGPFSFVGEVYAAASVDREGKGRAVLDLLHAQATILSGANRHLTQARPSTM
jgi:hypothetical protein